MKQEHELYHSANGDRWLLCRDGDHVFVLHRANESLAAGSRNFNLVISCGKVRSAGRISCSCHSACNIDPALPHQ